jgi:G3E family GTPase
MYPEAGGRGLHCWWVEVDWQPMSNTSDRVPFTILTGYLGAGKTTALNRLLSAPLGRRIAVLVNELGRIAIDSRLILWRGGDVLELAGGCVCCKIDVKNDLWDGIADVIRRSSPDHVVLETTGIAEPDAIIEGLHRLPEAERERIDVAGIVCVVDADAGAAQIDRRDEARAQVLAADRLLLSKLDVASAATAEALHHRLRALNPHAELASFPAGEASSVALGHWLLEQRALAARPGGHVHAHGQGQLVAASFCDSAPLLSGPLMALIEELGDRLVRAKGFVHLAGESRRGFIERAGTRTTLVYGGPWGDETPRTELVLIGEDLDEAALQRRLWACRVSPGQDTPP